MINTKRKYPLLFIISKLSILIFYFVSTTLHAEGLRQLNHVKTISQNAIYDFTEDNIGFIWFATATNMTRFDGNKVKEYLLVDPLFENDSPVEERKSTKYDPNGNLWVATYSGKIYRYNTQFDKFDIEIDFREQIGVSYIGIKDMFFVGKYILFGSDNGILRYDSETKTYEYVYSETDMKVNRFLFYNKILYVGKDRGVSLFKFTSDAQLKRLSTPTELENYMMSQIKTITTGVKKNTLLMGTFDNGVLEWDLSQKKISSVINISLPILNIITFRERVYIAVDGGGLSIFDGFDYNCINEQGERLTMISPIYIENVRSLFLDKNERIWYGTDTQVCYQDERQFYWKRTSLKNDTSNKLQKLGGVIEDYKGNVWCLTNFGVSIKKNGASKWESVYFSGKESTQIFSPLCIIERQNKTIWIGGYCMGLYEIDIETFRVKKLYTTSNSRISTNSIYAMLEEQNGDVWIGGRDGVLCKYIKSLNKFVHYPSISEVNYIALRNQNEIYIASSYNLVVVNKETGNWKSIIDPSFQNNKKRIITTNQLLTVGDTALYVATEADGLYVVDMRTNKYKQYTITEGLYSNCIKALAIDFHGRIWMSCPQTIASFDATSKSFKNFSPSYEIKNEKFQTHACASLKNGEIVFCTNNELVHFDPEQMKTASINAQITLTSFAVNGISQYAGENAILKQSIDSTSTIKLKYNENYFNIEFVAIEYGFPYKILYSAFLEGYENEWQTPQETGEALFKNIPPGKYTLHLKSLNRENFSEIDRRIISIIVTPPFWKSNIAYTFYLLIIAFICYWIGKNYHLHLKRKQHEEMINFFVLVAHDIRIPLSLIISPLKDLEQQKMILPEGKYYVNIMQRNIERLNLLVTQLLDFQNSQTHKIKLNLKTTEIVGFIAQNVQNFEAKAIEKNITLSIESQPQRFYASIDTEKIEKVIVNLLSNAIKYTPEGGKIEVILKEEEKIWTLTVKDNGIGIPKEEQKRLFKYFYRASNVQHAGTSGSGLGLMIVENFTRLHKGTISFESNRNQGSSFFLSFPIGEKEFSTHIVTYNKTIQPPPAVITKEYIDADTCLHKLLVVDDDDDIRNYLVKSLEQQYNVISAEDAEIGMRLIKRDNPNLVISDVMMPLISGYEFCAQIKGNIETSHIPVILLTALCDNDQKIMGYDVHADDYISKPFDIDLLKSRIANILNIRENLKRKFMRLSTQPDSDELKNDTDPNTIFVNKLSAFIKSNISNSELQINDIAQELGLSKTGLYNKTVALTGYTPIEYIKIIRMKKAVTLLTLKKYSILQIAEMVGFSDPKYFSRSFKKFYGTTPKGFDPLNVEKGKEDNKYDIIDTLNTLP